MYQVSFRRENKTITVEAGITILEAERLAGLVPDAPCGGSGKCGKCRVKVNGQTVLACQTVIESDLTVDTQVQTGDHEILTEGFSRPMPYEPGLQQRKIQLKRAIPGEKRSDWERMLDALHAAGGPKPAEVKADLQMASSLYDMRLETEDWYVIHTEDEILEMRKEAGKRYFAAFDIGTTTVAGYLLDAADGSLAAVESRMNPQAQYGADVVLRANYVLEHENGLQELSGCIRDCVNEMLRALAQSAGADLADVFQVSIVGNTCMHHLFLGISPASLVHAPYTPAICQRMTLRAAAYGIEIHPKGQLLMLPDIAGYVGADTCGCLLTVRPDQKEEITLMLDIGTNGELVLGNKDRLITCSTAAGPALEGAKIECGMRGAAGAVDHVTYKDGKWSYTTIGDQPAVGICGSGLIDLIAKLVEEEIIDDTGRMESDQEDPQVFVLVPQSEAGNGIGVYLTQKDVREVQLAKAAIAAGIQLMMEELDISEEDISKVYIAGAFGNYMDPISAGTIGMIPRTLTDRICPIGNAAGEGAKIALVNRKELKEIDDVVRRIDFIELASSADFQDTFVDELGFDME